jgi:hypothetical protein
MDQFIIFCPEINTYVGGFASFNIFKTAIQDMPTNKIFKQYFVGPESAFVFDKADIVFLNKDLNIDFNSNYLNHVFGLTGFTFVKMEVM